MHESAFWLSTNVLQSWLTCVASVPLTFPYVFRKFEVGNALSQKLEAGKGRSPASYGTLTTDKQYTLLLVIDDDTLCFCHWPRRAEALYSWAARLCVRALFCNQARSQGGWELNPQKDFLERGTEKSGTISLVQMHQNASFQHQNPTNYSLLQNVLWYCLYSFICTKLSKLILRKIIEIVAKIRLILSPKCTKFDVGLGSVPDPAGELTALPQTPSWI